MTFLTNVETQDVVSGAQAPVLPDGLRGSYRHDQLFDLADAYVGAEDVTRLPVSVGHIVLCKEMGPIGTVREFMPVHRREAAQGVEAVGHRTVLSFTETADGQIYARRGRLAFSHSSQRRHVEGLFPLDDTDHEQLDILKTILQQTLGSS